MKIDKSFNIIAMLSVWLVSFFFRVKNGDSIQKKNWLNPTKNRKKLSNYRKLTNNQPIASYCRDPN